MKRFLIGAVLAIAVISCVAEVTPSDPSNAGSSDLSDQLAHAQPVMLRESNVLPRITPAPPLPISPLRAEAEEAARHAPIEEWDEEDREAEAFTCIELIFTDDIGVGPLYDFMSKVRCDWDIDRLNRQGEERNSTPYQIYAGSSSNVFVFNEFDPRDIEEDDPERGEWTDFDDDRERTMLFGRSFFVQLDHRFPDERGRYTWQPDAPITVTIRFDIEYGCNCDLYYVFEMPQQLPGKFSHRRIELTTSELLHECGCMITWQPTSAGCEKIDRLLYSCEIDEWLPPSRESEWFETLDAPGSERELLAPRPFKSGVVRADCREVVPREHPDFGYVAFIPRRASSLFLTLSMTDYYEEIAWKNVAHTERAIYEFGEVPLTSHMIALGDVALEGGGVIEVSADLAFNTAKEESEYNAFIEKNRSAGFTFSPRWEIGSPIYQMDRSRTYAPSYALGKSVRIWMPQNFLEVSVTVDDDAFDSGGEQPAWLEIYFQATTFTANVRSDAITKRHVTIWPESSWHIDVLAEADGEELDAAIYLLSAVAE